MKTFINKNTHKYLNGGILFVILACFSMLYISSVVVPSSGNELRMQTFPSGLGWGYEIMQGDRTFIRQPYMPAIPGRLPFSTREEAGKAGKLVLQKIRHHKSPALSVKELDSLKIQLK